MVTSAAPSYLTFDELRDVNIPTPPELRKRELETAATQAEEEAALAIARAQKMRRDAEVFTGV